MISLRLVLRIAVVYRVLILASPVTVADQFLWREGLSSADRDDTLEEYVLNGRLSAEPHTSC